jgi:SNF2 family DNA or RNA helicase
MTSRKSSPSIQAEGTQPRLWTPHHYQRQALRWLLAHAGAGLFLDPGLGKTSINLAAMKVLKKEGELDDAPALIVCELTPLYNVWDPRNPESEPRIWTDFHGLKMEVLHGDDKDVKLRVKCDVRLINPEGLAWYFSKVKVPPGRFPLLCIDESTRFKHTNNERFRLLRPWLPAFRRRWINTGTPSPNGLIDLFGQIFVLDMGNALGGYITHYRRRFFQPTGYGGYTWVLQGSNVKEQEQTAQRVYEAISPLVLRMDEKDYLTLPKIHGSAAHGDREPAVTRVTLPPRAAAKFAELEDTFVAEMDGGRVTAANAAVKHMKLRQAANGGVYLEHLHDAKTDAVVEMLDEADVGGAVVAVEFHHDLERLRAHRRLRNLVAMGEGSKREDAALLADWNAGRLRELCVNPASFARGSNAQRGGDLLIFHSLIWNFEDYDQLIRRFWRQGRTRPFYVRHIVAAGTHDATMLRVTASKNRTQRSLLDALRAHTQKRLRRS